MEALLRHVWPRSLFTANLARRTPMTLRGFMDRTNNFVNIEDTLQVLIAPEKIETKEIDRGVRRIGEKRSKEKSRWT